MEEKDLTKMTVTRLREEAKKYTSIQGVTAMKKEELIRAIADARGEPIDIKKKKTKKKKKKEVDVVSLKKAMKALRKEKAEARKSKSRKEIERLRRKIKDLKRQTRKYGQEKAALSAAEGKKGDKEAASPAKVQEAAASAPPQTETGSGTTGAES